MRRFRRVMSCQGFIITYQITHRASHQRVQEKLDDEGRSERVSFLQYLAEKLLGACRRAELLETSAWTFLIKKIALWTATVTKLRPERKKVIRVSLE